LIGHAVTSSVDGPIGWLVLHREDGRSSLDGAALAELYDAVLTMNSESLVDVVVVSSDGPDFCPPASETLDSGDPSDLARLARLMGHLTFELRNGPKPYIGAVRGNCSGRGNALQLHFDLVVASETAVFSHPETEAGELPFWATPQLLPLMIGERRARELLLLGTDVAADEALAIGLVNAVVADTDLERATRELASRLLKRSRTALRLTKVALNGLADMLTPATAHEAVVMSMVRRGEPHSHG
jgi:enoyl-CoA hydratase/carnithine racemase